MLADVVEAIRALAPRRSRRGRDAGPATSGEAARALGAEARVADDPGLNAALDAAAAALADPAGALLVVLGDVAGARARRARRACSTRSTSWAARARCSRPRATAAPPRCCAARPARSRLVSAKDSAKAHRAAAERTGVPFRELAAALARDRSRPPRGRARAARERHAGAAHARAARARARARRADASASRSARSPACPRSRPAPTSPRCSRDAAARERHRARGRRPRRLPEDRVEGRGPARGPARHRAARRGAPDRRRGRQGPAPHRGDPARDGARGAARQGRLDLGDRARLHLRERGRRSLERARGRRRGAAARRPRRLGAAPARRARRARREVRSA